MSDEKHGKSQAYQKTRAGFDGLSMDERAAFLVESAVAMMADGVGQAGKMMSDVLDDLAQKVDECYDEEADPEVKDAKEKAAPAAKKTASRRRTSSGTRKTGGTGKKKGSSGSKKS